MVNNRAWIRIVEASIAILLIFGVLITLNVAKLQTTNTDLSEKIPALLEKVALNETLRAKIISSSEDNMNLTETEIENFIRPDINNPNLNYSVKICDLSSFCTLEPYPSHDVYAGERVISASLTQISPKKIKLFIWANN